MTSSPLLLNSSQREQNGRHFADDISKYIFFNEKFFILIRIPLKCVSMSPNDNAWELVQVMAWRRIGDKPLPEPMLTQFTDAYMRHYMGRWVKYKKNIVLFRLTMSLVTVHPIT